MTVLNVDDSVTMRKIVSIALRGKGYEVLEAANGMEALQGMKEKRPDAIILDINMPVMNGIEFLKERSKVAAYASIPVVVLTTQGEDGLKNEALALGAKAFMIKPFKKEELVSTIEGLL